jgi:hypothetical protein
MSNDSPAGVIIRVAAPPSTSTKKMRRSDAIVLAVKTKMKTMDARVCFSMGLSGDKGTMVF